ncbi:RING finger protein [Fragariocoptes setiger]|uniref:RING finger protein n=1 Tax=Fragariocoptes setiger TaxID=1670756 RepID=A0ABQ7SA02_9ACAR|nr:RING finger protein [Fragariocoptes setiger]
MEIETFEKDLNVSDMTEQEREHYLLHKKHAGHGKQHLEAIWRPLIVPNFSRSGSSIPRLLYRWFYVLYSTSSVIAVTGYIVIMLTFFGLNVLLGLPPQLTLDFGFLMLFYGIYYGVLCRDFTDFLVDKLAARIGYYNPKSALPSRALDKSICAICGRSHGSKNIEGIQSNSHAEPLMTSYLQEISATEAVEMSESDYECQSAPTEERIIVLACGHKFHEYCIYGWCLVGKRQPHYLYGNFLDFIRYLLTWQPLIFFVVHIVNSSLGLE